MHRIIILLLTGCLILWGCASGGVSPEQSQLQIREFQTRSYDTKDTLMVMKALLNVLQDEQFIVKNADKDLGLLTAAKEIDVANNTEAFFSSFFLGTDARFKKNSIIECSGNVTEFGEKTRVRINFQAKTLNNKGEVMTVKQIEDPKYYQDFFSKVDKGIFIEKEGI
jgi:PBP1b-binding outer membrane lipoprotein LpoB